MSKLSIRKPVVAAYWSPDRLDYVVAERKSKHVRIVAAGSVSWDPEEDERSPGQVLAEQLRGIAGRRSELLVALGRGSVDVIPLQLPPAGDDELPTLVTNQVMRDAGDIAETGVVDFVALPAAAEEPRSGFAFAVDSVILDQVRAEATAAGLKLTSVVYRPLASVTLLQRVVPQAHRTMILITLHDREADISIVRGGGLSYTRTARLSEVRNVGDVAAQLAVEVRRSLAAASLSPDAENQHLYMFGALQETEQLVQDLAEELSLPASLLDPLRIERVEGPTPERVGRLAPLIGMVHDHFSKTHSTDFLNPKQPPAPPNPLRRVAAYAAVAVLVIAAGVYLVWNSQAESAAEIADLKAELDKTSDRLGKVQQRQAVVDAVRQWQSDGINWLDEFYDLASRFPSGQDAMIRRLSVSPGPRGRSVINLDVYVRDPAVMDQMEHQLLDEFHEVRITDVSEQSATGDYPWHFDTTITVTPRDTQQYRQEFPTPDDPATGDIARIE